jgi:hypothetical protein
VAIEITDSAAPVTFLGAFTVTSLPMTLTPNSGPPGTILSIAGSGFTPNITGWVWFDSNRDGVRNAGEPQVSVTTTSAGTFPAGVTLGAATVAAGDYLVLADIPGGEPKEAAATFTVTTPTLTPAPVSGPPGPPTIPIVLGGTNIVIGGTNYAPLTAGVVWMDIPGGTNIAGQRDAGEPFANVTTDGAGAFVGATFACPSVPGTVAGVVYNLQADIPAGGVVEVTNTFSVTSIGINNPITGAPGTVIAISGAGFPALQTGWAYLDSNPVNTTRDPVEAQIGFATTAAGEIPGGLTLTVPAGTAVGSYFVRFDVATNTAVVAVPFTVPAPTGTVTIPPTGPGTIITVAGTGFAVNTAGNVWVDLPGGTANVRDPLEPQVAVLSDATGIIPATVLSVPPLPGAAGAGVNYPVLFDVPAGLPIESSPNYTVVSTINIAPIAGPIGTPIAITGGGFPANATGFLYLDIDASGTRNAGDVVSALITCDANGTIPGTVSLTVPVGAPSSLNVYAEIPTAGGNAATRAFTVQVPTFALTPTSGPAGTVITISGTNFVLSTAGFVWFDSNSDGVRDAGETQVAVTTTAAGAIPAGTTLTAPSVEVDTYPVQADIPTGGAVEASATFTVITEGPRPDWVTTIITKIDAIAAKLDAPNGTFYTFVKDWFMTIEGKLDNTTYGLEAIKNAIDDIEVGGGGLASSAWSQTLAAGASIPIVPSGTTPILGTLSIQSTGTGYDVDVFYTGTTWITIVESGARNASYPLSGFGLRIVNDTRYSMIVTYAVVYHKGP